jgi:uncharacterized protein (DUF4415 family)
LLPFQRTAYPPAKPLAMSKKSFSKPSEGQTDWQRLRSMKDEDIDSSDIPLIDPAAFARGLSREGLTQRVGKDQITLRLDKDVLAWFRATGSGFQSRINALLRAYMDAHKPEGKWRSLRLFSGLRYSRIAASRKAAGRPIAQFDAMIAAVARSRGAALATRNLKDFDDCGVELMDPWGS